jgi:peptidoglycan hydrolase-like protein with peptidoglycan-binding domain
MKGTTNTVANRNCLLRERNRSDAVKALQYAAAFCYGQWDEEEGFEDLDGIFGPKTKAWVENVQSAVGVTADGIYGNNTHNAMAFWRETLYYSGLAVHYCAFDPVAV